MPGRELFQPMGVVVEDDTCPSGVRVWNREEILRLPKFRSAPVRFAMLMSPAVFTSVFGPGPRKGPGLTGKRYRQARRRWGKLNRQVRRAYRARAR